MPLEARNISFRYDRKEPFVLENVSLSVDRGERVALFAPSGYGKTTLVKLMSGYLEPTEGQVLLDGKPLPKKGVCPVQLIYQHPEKAINPRWRLKRVLEESGEMREDVLEAFGIERAWLERFPRELSGGELQRFCVARALMSGAEYLICDEISTMLDVITQAQIWNVVLEEARKRNMGIIAVTHNWHLANRIADRIYDLSRQEYINVKKEKETETMHEHHYFDQHHTHSHEHDHHHSHTPMEELLALMKYMTGHNAAHAKELADLAVKLDEAGSHASYQKVMDAVACFEQGNNMLAEVLKELATK